MKTFSHHQPGTDGPYRFTPDDICQLFEDDRFEVLETFDTVYQGQFDPNPKALFSSIRRSAGPGRTCSSRDEPVANA